MIFLKEEVYEKKEQSDLVLHWLHFYHGFLEKNYL